MLLENYTGDSKLIKRIAYLLNRKAQLPLDQSGNVDWGTDGEVLATDGNGGTKWVPAGGGGSPSASDVSYDNTGSGLSADDVQEAIDELAGDIPTKTSDLTNDSGFITNAVNNLANYYLKSETYTQAEVDALISAIATVHFEVVQTLPVSDIQTNVIYLVPSSDPGTQNIYDEYINTTGTSAGWELIGSTQVDLSDYVTTSDLATALADYVTSADLTTILANYVQSSALATVATSGNYDDLTNKPTIPAPQVQSDWAQADSTAVDYIKNKPTIPSGGVTDVEVNGTSVVSGGVASVTVPTALSNLSEDTTHRVVTDTEKSTWSGKVSDNPTFTEASTRANIASGESFATILGKIKKFFSDLKTVAFTGSYNDLSNKPTIPAAQVNSDWNASSGVAQILNKPTIPDISTKVSKSGDTMTGRLTANGRITAKTNGGSFISQKDTENAAIQIIPDAVMNGSRFDSIISGKNTDGSTWCIGIINNTLYIGYFAADHTTNNFTKAFTFPLSSKGGTVAVTSELDSKNFIKDVGNATNTTFAYSKAALALGDFTWLAAWNGYELRGVNKSNFITTANIGSQSVNYANSAGSATKIASYYSSRPSSANVQLSSDPSAITFMATSSMTTGKPSSDSHILHFGWDNNNGWNGQLAIPTDNSGHAQWRTQTGTTWQSWKTLVDTTDVATSATANKVAQRDGSGHLTMNDCICNSVRVASSSEWLPIRGGGAVTIRNYANSAYVPAMASAFTVSSSRRYKENIEDMAEEDAIGLLALRVVTFDYKEGIIDGNRTGQKGLIAEEVAEIETFPVVYNQDGEVEGLDYSKFVPQLIKLCQMQQKQIDDLTARLEVLESRM